MKKFSAIIADDEINLCSHLQLLLRKLWPELDIIGTAYSGSEALSLIKQEEPDVAFLDIKMPVMNGINVAMHCQGLCHIVFITAFDEYAIQAFEHNAIDYLLKPVMDDRLTLTINRLQKGILKDKANDVNMTDLLEKLSTKLNLPKQSHHLQWIRAGKKDKTLLIPVDKILYFQASGKYTTVVTHDGEYLIRKPIKELIADLDSNQFWQINRGIIVNVSYILSTKREAHGGFNINLKNNNKILISSRKYNHLFKQM